MDDIQKRIFHSNRKLLETDVDPISVTDGLFQKGHFSSSQRRNLYKIAQGNRDRTCVWNALTLLIPETTNLKQLLSILLDNGYTDIAMLISHQLRVSSPESNNVYRFHRTKMGYSGQRFAQKLFMNFKINTHNNAFVNPRQYCHEESRKYKNQLEMYHGDDEEARTNIADRYAACLLAEIDSHIMLYTIKSPVNDLIKEFKRVIPLTSNSNVTQLSCDSRTAMACALSGKESEGEDYIQNAMVKSLFVGRCVELSNLFYIYVFYLLYWYEKFPTKSFRDKIIHIAELGIQSTDDDDDRIREFWVRLFLLRIIYCLLGLSYRGDPIYAITINADSIRRAKQLLTEIDRLWSGMEARRKIMYYVAKARIAELEKRDGYIDNVLHFLNMAIDIGNEGEYGETQYVKHYASFFSPTKSGSVDNSYSFGPSATHPSFSSKNSQSNVMTFNEKCNWSGQNICFTEVKSDIIDENEETNEKFIKEIENNSQILGKDETDSKFIEGNKCYEKDDTDPKLQKELNDDSIVTQIHEKAETNSRHTTEFDYMSTFSQRSNVKHVERMPYSLETTSAFDGALNETRRHVAVKKTFGVVQVCDTFINTLEILESDDTVLKALNIQKVTCNTPIKEETNLKTLSKTNPDIKRSSSSRSLTDDTDVKVADICDKDDTIFIEDTDPKLYLKTETNEQSLDKKTDMTSPTVEKLVTTVDDDLTSVKSPCLLNGNNQVADHSNMKSFSFYDIHQFDTGY